MLNKESILEGRPIPSVNVDDLRRIWSLLSQMSEPETALSSEVLQQHCSALSDPLAVYLRATLMKGLVDQGLLQKYQSGNGIPDDVFDRVATFPIPNGLQNINQNDLDPFVAGLNSLS